MSVSDSTTLQIKDDVSKPFGNNSLSRFRVTWKDLTYAVPQLSSGRQTSKVILNGVSGHFDSGKVTAIMGPSGGGKSSLLGCICKQKTIGVSGAITISTDIQMKFAFIAQENHILEKLSVRESLMFASRLKNGPNADHKTIINEVVQQLMLDKCADNRPSKCSGGQLKRVLIACELVSKPNILILDEPTSGLDSVTTWQLVNLLLDLTRQSEPMAVVITIHQPSARLFNLLDSIYLLSCEGQCIYQGAPHRMLLHFSGVGLHCPSRTNPSDFALEVAAKDYGPAKVLMLATIMKIECMDMKTMAYDIKIVRKFRTFDNIIILTQRSVRSMLRDPLMIPLRIGCYVMSALLISILFGFDSGVMSGCSHDFALGDGQNLVSKFKEIIADVFENVAALSVVCLLGWFTGLFPILLIFPNELNVFLKEYGNGYYSVFSYFMSKVLSDLPFTILLPNLASIPIYLMTGQYLASMSHLYSFAFIFILVNLNSSALGFLLGASLAEHPTAIAFLGILSLIPLILLSGIMCGIERMPSYFRWLVRFNYIRFGLVATLLNSYGFDRCSVATANQTNFLDIIPDDKMIALFASDKIDAFALVKALDSVLNGVIGEDRSVILNGLSLVDSDYYNAIAMLFIHIVFFRLATYCIIMKKIRSRS